VIAPTGVELAPTKIANRTDKRERVRTDKDHGCTDKDRRRTDKRQKDCTDKRQVVAR
jgi:hypothetical protein